MSVRRSAESQSALQLLSPMTLAHDLWEHRTLIHQFSRTSLTSGNRDSFLGQIWIILDPLILLSIYGFVFGTLFGGSRGGSHYVLSIYAGMLTYQLFSQSANAAGGAVVSARNYVKQLVFPIQIMPVALVGGILFSTAIGFVLLLLATLIFKGVFHWQSILVPLVMVPVVFFALGSAWLFGALSVFIPDVRKITAVMTQIGFFLTPIVWPLANFHDERFRWIIMLNPMTTLVESVRGLVLEGHMPHWGPWLVILVISAVFCQVGYLFFMKVRAGFADVL